MSGSGERIEDREVLSELLKQGLVRLAAAELTGILGNDSKGGFLAIRDKKGNDISTMRSY